jgi:hypothetical protein
VATVLLFAWPGGWSLGSSLAIGFSLFAFAHSLAVSANAVQLPARARLLDAPFKPAQWLAAGILLASAATWFGVNYLRHDAAVRAEAVLAFDLPSGSSLIDRLLVGQLSGTQVVLTNSDSDPLGLCDGHSLPVLLARTESDFIIALFPNRGERSTGVVRAPASHYSVITGIGRSRPCPALVPKEAPQSQT